MRRHALTERVKAAALRLRLPTLLFLAWLAIQEILWDRFTSWANPHLDRLVVPVVGDLVRLLIASVDVVFSAAFLGAVLFSLYRAATYPVAVPAEVPVRVPLERANEPRPTLPLGISVRPVATPNIADLVPATPATTPLALHMRIDVEDIKDNIPIRFGDGTEARLIQVWFRNVSTEMVKQVSAEITVDDEHRDTTYVEGYGRWAVGTAPQNVASWTELPIRLDFPPKGVGKLNVLVGRKHPHSQHRVAFIFDKDTNNPDYFYAGDYKVAVEMRGGGGYDRTFRFRLRFTEDDFELVHGH